MSGKFNEWLNKVMDRVPFPEAGDYGVAGRPRSRRRVHQHTRHPEQHRVERHADHG